MRNIRTAQISVKNGDYKVRVQGEGEEYTHRQGGVYMKSVELWTLICTPPKLKIFKFEHYF